MTTFVEKDAAGKTVNRCEGHRVHRRVHGHERIQLSGREEYAQHGGGAI